MPKKTDPADPLAIKAQEALVPSCFQGCTEGSFFQEKEQQVSEEASYQLESSLSLQELNPALQHTEA
ncbi:hypothetical protein AOLI_G00024200 [Acnodon oligacanthus]